MASKVKFFADLGVQSALDTQVDGDLTVAGNLTVTGTTVTVNSTTTSIGDSMFELANQNTSADLIDIGIYGNYNDGLSDGGASELFNPAAYKIASMTGTEVVVDVSSVGLLKTLIFRAFTA